MRYLALLRGINVGGNKKVEMSRLKSCFEKMGYTNVRTYINSGNVIFESESGDFGQITEILEKEFGFPIAVIFRDADNIVRIARAIPSEWKNDSEHKTDVIFLGAGYESEESMKLIRMHPEIDQLLYVGQAIIWHIEKKDYSQSKMHDFIGTELYRNMTARNVNTVRKLAELIEAS